MSWKERVMRWLFPSLYQRVDRLENAVVLLVRIKSLKAQINHPIDKKDLFSRMQKLADLFYQEQELVE